MATPPDIQTAAAASPLARYVLNAARLLVGYILAVAAGSLVGAITGALVPGFTFMPDPTDAGLLADIFNTAFMYFILGTIFGLPYALVGTIIFWRWLPKSALLFLAIGMLCPSTAIFLTLYFIDGLRAFSAPVFTFMALTMPAGLVAAYVYGAIGMGYGFGRWRLG
jgi:hypothetical protein